MSDAQPVRASCRRTATPERTRRTTAPDGRRATAGRRARHAGRCRATDAASRSLGAPDGRSTSRPSRRSRRGGTILTDAAGLAAERDEYLDALQRLQADFENYRKRVAAPAGRSSRPGRRGARRASCCRCSTRSTSRAPTSAAGRGATADEATALRQARALLLDALAKEGLSGSTTPASPFDPTVHDAVAHDPGRRGRRRRRAGGGPIVDEVLRAGLPLAGPGAAAGDGRRSGAEPMAPQREWFEKDYYKVLGVSVDGDRQGDHAGLPQARQAVPPDANPGSEDRFKEISAAYDVLGDADKRKEYDEVRRLGPMAGGFGGGRLRRRPAAADVPGRRPRRPSATSSAGSSAAAGPAPAGPRAPARRRRRGRAAPVLRGRGARRRRRRSTSPSDAPLPHLRRHRRGARDDARRPARAAAARARSTTTRACSRSRTLCPECHGRGTHDRRRRARPATAPGTERREPPGEGAHPGRAWRTASDPRQGPGRAGRSGGAGRRPLRRRPRRARTRFRPARPQPHPDRAGHLPRGRLGHDDHRADPRRARSRCRSRRARASGKTLRVKGPGRAGGRTAQGRRPARHGRRRRAEGLTDEQRAAVEALGDRRRADGARVRTSRRSA